MQFRAEVENSGLRRVIRLAGRLEGEQTTELVRLFEGAHRVVRLEMTDLLSADAVGIETLGTLQIRGAELVGASPYLALQLDHWQASRIRPLGESVPEAGNPSGRRNEHTGKTEDR